MGAAGRHADRVAGHWPHDTALPLVLGANIGSGLLAVLMTLKSARPGASRVPGQSVLQTGRRLAVAIPFIRLIANYRRGLGFPHAQVVIAFHLVFNIGTGRHLHPA